MRAKRWFLRILLSAGLALGVVLLLIWWQERGLTTIENQLAAGDVAGALEAADHFLAAHPGHSKATALRAHALLAAGRIQEAIRLFEQVGAIEPKDLRAWSIGLIYLDQPRDALAILERLLQLEPGNAETLEMITVCRSEAGNRPAALESASRLAELSGQEATGHLHSACIYQDWGYPSLANQHFAKVLQYRPDASGLRLEPAQFFLNYGECLLAAGNARRALGILDRSAQWKLSREVTLRQAEAWQQIGDHRRAQELLEQVLRQDPENLIARERLAESALHMQDASSAEAWLQPLIEQNAISANAAYLLQRVYTALGKDELAQEWQQKAVSLRAAKKGRSQTDSSSGR